MGHVLNVPIIRHYVPFHKQKQSFKKGGNNEKNDVVFRFTMGGQTLAIPCQDGEIIIAKNGHEFCKSNVLVNWWSAEAWCHSQGENVHLASLETVCAGAARKANGASCSNLSLNQAMEAGLWTSFAVDTFHAMRVRPDGGTMFLGNCGDSIYYALCDIE